MGIERVRWIKQDKRKRGSIHSLVELEPSLMEYFETVKQEEERNELNYEAKSMVCVQLQKILEASFS